MPAAKIAAKDEEPTNRDEAFAELGLSHSASDDEVRNAFRLRIKEAHPDLNGGTDTLLRRLILARDLLMSDVHNTTPERLRTLAAADEPLRLDINLAQAIAGGEVSAEVPALEVAAAHEELTSLTQVKRLIVPLPPGLRNGDIVKVKTEGARGEQAFRIHILVSDSLRIWGDDIWMTAGVEARLFTLGGVATIDTPHGPHEVTIDKETAPGSGLTLKGMGLPASETCPAGNLVVRLEAREAEMKPYTEALGAFRQRWAS